MKDGLILNEEQFLSLPQKERDTILYRNQICTLVKLDEIQKLLENNRLDKRVQYAWLTALTTIAGWLLQRSFFLLPLLVLL
jgi:hypothetical protein